MKCYSYQLHNEYQNVFYQIFCQISHKFIFFLKNVLDKPFHTEFLQKTAPLFSVDQLVQFLQKFCVNVKRFAKYILKKNGLQLKSLLTCLVFLGINSKNDVQACLKLQLWAVSQQDIIYQWFSDFIINQARFL